MSRSPIEHLADAPPRLRRAVRLLWMLGTCPLDQRTQALGKLPPRVARVVADRLPPSQLVGAEARLWMLEVLAESLGPDRGGREIAEDLVSGARGHALRQRWGAAS